MNSRRSVGDVWRNRATLEGAGVRLHRVFGNEQVPRLDPFLMLDDFGSDKPEDYLKGFPWHPHRGIETVTYLDRGTVAHGDSIGNAGAIGPGDLQWMTAGSGIIHQEMPQAPADRVLRGFQLWVNLPAKHKMMAPRYRGIEAAGIPSASLAKGVSAKVIAGEAGGVRGPVKDLVVDVSYLDVTATPAAACEHPVAADQRCLAYVVDGEGTFAGTRVSAGHLVLFEGQGAVAAGAGPRGCRYLLLSGVPLGEPVAWYGPIVMNTDEELETAFREYRDGTFVKVGAANY
ncbi:MAG: pirin family protein [Candidatus Methylomirabilia bacterium]